MTDLVGWCAALFDRLDEGNRWVVMRTGLTFQKQGNRLVLVSLLKNHEQRLEYQEIVQQFARAGIIVKTGQEQK